MTDLPWYHRTSIYQVYPRSFYDSNADGIGDLPGLIQKLDYIRDLGFETIWCSPFFASPQQDLGYDISDYTAIAPEYGTLEDALQLIREVHRRKMKIIFDMVMNHTSAEHPWFKESRASRDNPRADWYLWRDHPNNWQSITGGSGWHYVPERRQYYWATFLPFQPDLNYRNPGVRQAMLETVRFWLGRGVDGFRLDVFNALFKDPEFRNNPFSFKLIPDVNEFMGLFQKDLYITNQPEDFQFARELRGVCEPYGEKLLIGEVSGSRKVIRRYLGGEKNDGLGLVFDFEMLQFRFTAEYFFNLIRNLEQDFPEPFMPVFVFSNHDKRRSFTRLGANVRKARLLHLLQLTVRGVPCLYNGEEIGMSDLRLPASQALDPLGRKYQLVPRAVVDLLLHDVTNRDEVRSPMQWNGLDNAGFSSNSRTWLPVHPNFRTVNVEKEQREPDSLLNTIRTLLEIRKAQPALHSGSLELMERLPDGLLGYYRRFGGDQIAILMNFAGRDREIRFDAGNWDTLFKLSEKDGSNLSGFKLGGFGGIILKSRR